MSIRWSLTIFVMFFFEHNTFAASIPPQRVSAPITGAVMTLISSTGYHLIDEPAIDSSQSSKNTFGLDLGYQFSSIVEPGILYRHAQFYDASGGEGNVIRKDEIFGSICSINIMNVLGVLFDKGRWFPSGGIEIGYAWHSFSNSNLKTDQGKVFGVNINADPWRHGGLSAGVKTFYFEKQNPIKLYDFEIGLRYMF